jgi:hypothetical protein
MPDFPLDDRLVRLYWRGEGGTQTVRISAAGNPNVWEYQFRLSWGNHMTESQAKAHTTVDGLVEAILGSGGRRELSRPGTTARTTALLSAQPDEAWLAEATLAVERAINGLLKEFVSFPYLHRVEQSMHVRLFELLIGEPALRGAWPIGSSSHVTQLVHKEWPETGPHRGTRGHFDLAILGPNQLGAAHPDHFTGGYIEAGIAIEMGLNASKDHLSDDWVKLQTNRVRAGYLVDLRRGKSADDATLELILSRNPSIRSAYAHVDVHTGIANVKWLNDEGFQQYRPAA